MINETLIRLFHILKVNSFKQVTILFSFTKKSLLYINECNFYYDDIENCKNQLDQTESNTFLSYDLNDFYI
jgi:hypothetical protein